MKYIKLTGHAEHLFFEWKQKRDHIQDDRTRWLKDHPAYDGLAVYDSRVIGVVLDDDTEPEDWMKKGKRRLASGQTYWCGKRNYNAGKAFNAELSELDMPQHQDLFGDLGIPWMWRDGGKMKQCGLTHVGDVWFVTGAPDELPDLVDGCEVCKEWEFLKLKDEQEAA